MRKTLTAFATGAIVATALVACGTEPESDDGLSSDQIVGSATVVPDGDTEDVPDGSTEDESVAGDVEVVDIDLPIGYSHLAGHSSPDSVGLLCVGDYAFLYTWHIRGYGGGSGTTRFAEQDELCADIQVIQE